MTSYDDSARLFVKNPVKVWAMHYDGKNRHRVMEWVGKGCRVDDKDRFWIKTLEGEYVVKVGDFIIKGVKGEYYPCNPDVFKLTYSAVFAQGEDSK